ncbi:hypothetical protein [Streptomyces odontomachi]|uniref:hypothetical protein n=1 Tax=Streptomyces odontomachi TaxID=2944940 RepID=UPI00210C067F|nr:hypothetical protein [Streptomyces sp. ODS25]
MIYGMLVDQSVASLPGQGEAAPVGNAEHGVVSTVAFQAAIERDSPALIRAKMCS